MSAVVAALRETETKRNIERSFLLKFEIEGKAYRGTVAPPQHPTMRGEAVSSQVLQTGSFMMRLWEPNETERTVFVSTAHVALCEIEWLDGGD
jgi:hypothetical protein